MSFNFQLLLECTESREAADNLSCCKGDRLARMFLLQSHQLLLQAHSFPLRLFHDVRATVAWIPGRKYNQWSVTTIFSLEVTVSPAFHCRTKKCTQRREEPLLTSVNMDIVTQIRQRFAERQMCAVLQG